MPPRGKTLLIDDMRVLPADITARTFDEGIEALRAGDIRLLKLDHDLGDTDPKKTGYGIILFLEENPELWPEVISLVTANPVGRLNIEAALQSMGYRLYVPTVTWHRPEFHNENM